MVATRTSKIVAVLPIVPQMVSSAAVTVGCCSASNSSRWQTLLSSCASRKIAVVDMGTPFPKTKRGKLQMGCLSAGNLKEEKKGNLDTSHHITV